MQIYCGTDIIEVKRVKEAMLETKGFKEKVFTEKEIKVGETKGEKAKYEYYAGRFAAKEAIYKAMSNVKNDFSFWNVEILNDKANKNRPIVNFLDNSLNELKTNGKLTVDISISHIEEYATAMAIVKDNRSKSLT